MKYTNRQNYNNYYVYLRKAIKNDYAEGDRAKAELKQKQIINKKEKEIKKEETKNIKEQEIEKAYEYYNNLRDQKKQEIEEEAINTMIIHKSVRNNKMIYNKMKKTKIIEIVIRKFEGIIKNPISAVTETGYKTLNNA